MTEDTFNRAQLLCAAARVPAHSPTAGLESAFEDYAELNGRLPAGEFPDPTPLLRELCASLVGAHARIATLESELTAEKRSVDTLSRLMAALVPAVRDIERKLGMDSQFAPEPPTADIVDVGAALQPVSGFEEPPTAQIIDLMAALRKAIR